MLTKLLLIPVAFLWNINIVLFVFCPSQWLIVVRVNTGKQRKTFSIGRSRQNTNSTLSLGTSKNYSHMNIALLAVFWVKESSTFKSLLSLVCSVYFCSFSSCGLSRWKSGTVKPIAFPPELVFFCLPFSYCAKYTYFLEKQSTRKVRIRGKWELQHTGLLGWSWILK